MPYKQYSTIEEYTTPEKVTINEEDACTQENENRSAGLLTDEK